MYSVNETYENHILNTLVRRPKSKIVVDGTEYTGESHLKTFPKIEHSTEDMFGAFPAKTCEFEIYNLDGSVNLNGKEVSVYRGLVIDGMPQWVPMGIFKAENKDITTNLTSKTIKFKGSDRSHLFDVAFNSALHTYPCTVLDFVKQLCTNHSVTLISEDFPFASLELTTAPEFAEGVTERELIRKIAQLGGCIAQITRNGELKISQPETASIPITSGKYSSLSKERTVYVTSVTVSQSGAEDLTVSDSTNVGAYGEYVYKIADNPFIKDRQSEVIDEIENNILNRNITPFVLNGFIDDFIYDLNDTVTIRDKSGTEFTTPVLCLATQSRIKSDFKTEVQKEDNSSGGSLGGSLKQQVENSIKDNNNFKKAQTGLNELMANAMGLHTSTVDDGAGGKLYYFHDTEDIANATYIITLNSNGFAYTKGSGCWNGGAPVWQYGVDADSNAVLNTLALHGLIADWIKAGTLQSLNGSTFFNLDEGEIGSETTEEAVYIFCGSLSGGYIEKTLKKTSKLTFEAGSLVQSVTLETVPAEDEESEVIDSYSLSLGMFGDIQKGMMFNYLTTYYEKTGYFYFEKPDDWDEKTDLAKSSVLLVHYLAAQVYPNGITLTNSDTGEQTTVNSQGVKVRYQDSDTGYYSVADVSNNKVLLYRTDAEGNVVDNGAGTAYDEENGEYISGADSFAYSSGGTAGKIFSQAMGNIVPSENEPVIDLAQFVPEGKSLVHLRLTLSHYQGSSEYRIYFNLTDEKIYIDTKYVTASGTYAYRVPVVKDLITAGVCSTVDGTQLTLSTKGTGDSYGGYTCMIIEILNEA